MNSLVLTVSVSCFAVPVCLSSCQCVLLVSSLVLTVLVSMPHVCFCTSLSSCQCVLLESSYVLLVIVQRKIVSVVRVLYQFVCVHVGV